MKDKGETTTRRKLLQILTHGRFNDLVTIFGMHLDNSRAESCAQRVVTLQADDWTLPPQYDEYPEDGSLITIGCDSNHQMNSKALILALEIISVT